MMRKQLAIFVYFNEVWLAAGGVARLSMSEPMQFQPVKKPNAIAAASFRSRITIMIRDPKRFLFHHAQQHH